MVALSRMSMRVFALPYNQNLLLLLLVVVALARVMLSMVFAVSVAGISILPGFAAIRVCSVPFECNR